MAQQAEAKPDWQLKSEAEQATQAKEFLQHATESLATLSTDMANSLFLWLGIVAVIGLASAGLWIGTGVVALLVAWVWLRRRKARKQRQHLGQHRWKFRSLLKQAEDKMEERDKTFLRMYTDSILFPLAVPPHMRSVGPTDQAEDVRATLWGPDAHTWTYPLAGAVGMVEVLWEEYCAFSPHRGPGCGWGPSYNLREGLASEEAFLSQWGRRLSEAEKSDRLKEWRERFGQRMAEVKCEVCLTAVRMRDHIEGAISKLEGETAQFRRALMDLVDGEKTEGAIPTRDFMEGFREWHVIRGTSLECLRDKDRWTFEEADRVLEVCLADKEVRLACWGYDEVRDSLISPYGDRHLRKDCGSCRIFQNLSNAIEVLLEQDRVKGGWKGYTEREAVLVGMDGEFKMLRQIFGRGNPETMLREMIGTYQYAIERLQSLKGFGLDLDRLRSEIGAARKVIAKAYLAREGSKWARALAQLHYSPRVVLRVLGWPLRALVWMLTAPLEWLLRLLGIGSRISIWRKSVGGQLKSRFASYHAATGGAKSAAQPR